MALFKILKGLDENLPLVKKDGYCYYTIDHSLFYVDYLDNNNILQRKALNANGAQQILCPVYQENTDLIIGYTETGAAILATVFDTSPTKIPTNALVSEQLGIINSIKMDKENPEGTGSFSLNGQALGNNAIALGTSVIANADYSFALGNYLSSNEEYQTVLGKYNLVDSNQALIFGGGNGIADHLDQYKNIFTLDWSGNAFFSGTVKSAAPVEDNDLTTKEYVDFMTATSVDVGLTHTYLAATNDGQISFDFSYYPYTTIDDQTLVYFNGLLLIPNIHYTISGNNNQIITLINREASEGDYCHIVKYRTSADGIFVGGAATATPADIMNGVTAYTNDGSLMTGEFTIDEEIDTQESLIEQFNTTLG